MADIRLFVKGKKVVFDAEQVSLVLGFKWTIFRGRSTFYAKGYAAKPRRFIFMHRLLTGAGPRELVDHEDRNGLNNRLCNLRPANYRTNQHNQGKCAQAKSSRFKGVSWLRCRKRWEAYIFAGPIDPKGNARKKWLGLFKVEEDAARAYDDAARKYFGAMARTNFP